jgi:purine nucleosidase/pyrimidine-specific ribonucleoside hydrolase
MKPVILDMDPGVDDALAILLALRSPEITVKAITVVSGNIKLELCLSNVLKVLDILGIDDREAPIVAGGANRPFRREPVSVPSIHGCDGLGELCRFHEADGSKRYPESKRELSPRPAVDVILDLADSFRDTLTVVATGPLTNIAQAVIEDSRTMRKVGRMVVMGGAFRTPGNITPVAEFNAYADPDALQVVLDSGITPIIMVGLDVTHQVRLYRHYLHERVKASKTKIAQFVQDCTEFYMDFHRDNDGFDGCYLHDPLAVGVAIWHDLVKTQDLRVQVETCGNVAKGMTVADFRPRRSQLEKPNAGVCLDVNAEKFLNLFTERVLNIS